MAKEKQEKELETVNKADASVDVAVEQKEKNTVSETCLLYTSPSPRDLSTSRMPSSA